MLVTLAEMKTYLNEVTATYDDFLTQQIVLMSETIANYCGRVFESANYVQTFYYDDFNNLKKSLPLYHFPMQTINSVTDSEGTVIDPSLYRITKSGLLTNKDGWFQNRLDIVVDYDAGYSTIPEVIKSVVYSLVEERYNKKKTGMAINFGKDVQSVSIPGVMRVQYDYNLTTNDRNNKFGMIIGDYGNVLDYFRSERPLIGSIVGGTYVS